MGPPGMSLEELYQSALNGQPEEQAAPTQTVQPIQNQTVEQVPPTSLEDLYQYARGNVDPAAAPVRRQQLDMTQQPDLMFQRANTTKDPQGMLQQMSQFAQKMYQGTSNAVSNTMHGYGAPERPHPKFSGPMQNNKLPDQAPPGEHNVYTDGPDYETHIPLRPITGERNSHNAVPYGRADAAAALESAMKEARKRGIKIGITSAHRESDEQAALYAQLGPGVAAPPGVSAHERGMAFDLHGDLDRFAKVAVKYGFARPFANDPREQHHFTFGGMKTEELSGSGKLKLLSKKNKADLLQSEDEAKHYRQMYASATVSGYRGDIASALVSAESGGDWRAMSPVGALGKFQVMPENKDAVLKKLGMKPMSNGEFLGSQEAQIKVFNHIFGNLVKNYGNYPQALAAYNGGDGAVQWMKRQSSDIRTWSGDGDPNSWKAQTLPYVAKILSKVSSKPVTLEEAARLIQNGPQSADESARFGAGSEVSGEPVLPATRLKQYGDPGVMQALSDYTSSLFNMIVTPGQTHQDRFQSFAGALGYSPDGADQLYKNYLKNGGWHPEVGQPLDSHMSNMFLNQARGFLKNFTLGLSEWIPGARTPKAEQEYMESTRAGMGSYLFPHNRVASVTSGALLGLGDLVPEIAGYVAGPGKLKILERVQTLLGAGKAGARLVKAAGTMHPVAKGFLMAMGEELKAGASFFASEMNQRMSTGVLDEGKDMETAFLDALTPAKHNFFTGIALGILGRAAFGGAKLTGQFTNNLAGAAAGEANFISKNPVLRSMVWDKLPQSTQRLMRAATSKAFFETPKWMRKSIQNLMAKEIDIFGEMRNRQRNFQVKTAQADALEKTVAEGITPMRDSSSKILEEMSKKEAVLYSQNKETQQAFALLQQGNNDAATAASHYNGTLKPQYDSLLQKRAESQKAIEAAKGAGKEELNDALKMKKDLQDEFKQVKDDIDRVKAVPGFDEARKAHELMTKAGEAWNDFSTNQLPMKDSIGKVIHTAEMVQQQLMSKAQKLRQMAADPGHDIEDVGKTLDVTEYENYTDAFNREYKTGVQTTPKDVEHLQGLQESIHNWAKSNYLTTPEEVKNKTAQVMREIMDAVPNTVENAKRTIGYLNEFLDVNTKAGKEFKRNVPEKTREIIANNLKRFDTDFANFVQSPGSEIVSKADLTEGLGKTAFDALEMAFNVPGMGGMGAGVSSMVRSVRPVEAMAERAAMLQKLQDIQIGKQVPAYGNLMDIMGFSLSDIRQMTPAEAQLSGILGDVMVKKGADREFFAAMGPLKTVDRIISFATNVGRSMVERGKVTAMVAKYQRAHVEDQLLQGLKASGMNVTEIPRAEMEKLAYALDDAAELRKYIEQYPERKPYIASIVKAFGYIEEFKLNSPEQAAFFNSSYFPHRYPMFREYRETFGKFDDPDRGFYDQVVAKAQSSEYSRKYKTIRQAEGAYNEAKTEMENLRTQGNLPVLTPREFLFDLTTWQDRAQALGLPVNEESRNKIADIASKMMLGNPEKNVGALLEEHFGTTMLADAQRSFYRMLELGYANDSKQPLLIRRPKDISGKELNFEVPIGEVGHSTAAKKWFLGKEKAEYQPLSKIIGVTDISKVGDDPMHVSGKVSEYGNPKAMGDMYVHPQVAAYIKEHFAYKPTKLLGQTLHSEGFQSLVSSAMLSGTPYAYFNQVFGQMYKQANFSLAGASNFIDLGRFASQDAAHEHVLRMAAEAGLESTHIGALTKVAGEELMGTMKSLLEEEGKKWYELPTASEQVGAWMGYLHDSLADKTVLQKAGTFALAPVKGLIAADKWIQEKTLFEAVRSAQTGAWMMKSNELFQQMGPGLMAKGLRKEQAWQHATKAAADVINEEFGMMPKWWVADGARKAFFSGFLTPQVMRSRLTGMVNFLDSLLPKGSEGDPKALKVQFGNRFNHMDDITRQNVLANYRWQTIGAFGAAFMYANMLQWSLSKTWTSANPPGREFDIQIGDYYLSNPFFGHLRPVAKLFSNMYNTTTGHTSLRDVMSGIINTASPVWRAGIDAATGAEDMGESAQGTLAQKAVNSVGLLSEAHGALGGALDALGRPDLTDAIPIVGRPTNTFTGLNRSPIETPLSFAGVYPAPENPKNWYKGARDVYAKQQGILKTKIENALMSAAREGNPEYQAKKLDEAIALMKDGQVAPAVISKLNRESSLFIKPGQGDPDRILLTNDQINNIIGHVLDPQAYAVWKADKATRPELVKRLSEFRNAERTTSPGLNPLRDTLFKQGEL